MVNFLMNSQAASTVLCNLHSPQQYTKALFSPNSQFTMLGDVKQHPCGFDL
jgi:hypothetical protein